MTLYWLVVQAVTDNFNDEHWIWVNSLSEDGYGIVKISGTKKNKAVHILAYELRYGPVPEGKELDHTCRIRACWNPRHVEPVTHEENVKRGISYWSLQTHCINGHEFTEANTYHYKKVKKRGCKKCREYNNYKHLQRKLL